MCVLTAEERAQYDDQLFDAPDQKKEAKVKRRELDLQVRRSIVLAFFQKIRLDLY